MLKYIGLKSMNILYHWEDVGFGGKIREMQMMKNMHERGFHHHVFHSLRKEMQMSKLVKLMLIIFMKQYGRDFIHSKFFLFTNFHLAKVKEKKFLFFCSFKF